jgi:hypothetical protein
MEVMMRNVAVATITVAVALSVAALRAQDMPFPLPRLSFPPPELMVAPIAPKQQPEEEALGVERRASICQELVAFLVRTQTTDPRPPTAGPMPSAGDRGKANEATLSGIDEPQRSSGLTAPVPPGESAAKRPLVTLEQAQGYLRANDVRACQEAVRQMRRAGVALPESLIALAALRPEQLEAEPSSR